MNCLIVDDHVIARRTVSHLLQIDPSLKLIAECESAAEAYSNPAVHKIDLLLLDIEMPGISGIELVKGFGEARPLIIFITSQKDHAATAFELNVVDFITKPISKIELVGVLTQFLPKEVHSTKNIQSETREVQYQTIDLSYLKEVSMGDIAYECEITEKFIEIIADEIEVLNSELAAGYYEKMQRTAHKMLSTIYVMGLKPKLGAHLQAIEHDNLTKDELSYRVTPIAMICKKAKEEAQVFLAQ
jgi:DNA-binding LytR/AlgR family response regulator